MTTSKAIETLAKVLGFAGYVLLTFFAAMFAFLTLVAFISMFTGSFIAGLFGTAAAAFLTVITWSIRKDTL